DVRQGVMPLVPSGEGDHPGVAAVEDVGSDCPRDLVRPSGPDLGRADRARPDGAAGAQTGPMRDTRVFDDSGPLRVVADSPTLAHLLQARAARQNPPRQVPLTAPVLADRFGV